MSMGNQKFGIPRKYKYQIGIWYFCPKFLGIFFVFYRYFENDRVKIWLTIGIFRQNKNWLGIWFLWLPFHWYRFCFVIFLKMASLVGTLPARYYQGCTKWRYHLSVLLCWVVSVWISAWFSDCIGPVSVFDKSWVEWYWRGSCSWASLVWL